MWESGSGGNMVEVEKSLHGDKSGQGFSGPKERFFHCSDLGRSPTERRASSQHKRRFFYLFPDPSVAFRACQRPHVGDIVVEVENRVLCSHLGSRGVTPTHGPQMWAFRKHWDQAEVCNQLLEERPCSCSPVWTPESQPILFALQSLTFFNWLLHCRKPPPFSFSQDLQKESSVLWLAPRWWQVHHQGRPPRTTMLIWNYLNM